MTVERLPSRPNFRFDSQDPDQRVRATTANGDEFYLQGPHERRLWLVEAFAPPRVEHMLYKARESLWESLRGKPGWDDDKITKLVSHVRALVRPVGFDVGSEIWFSVRLWKGLPRSCPKTFGAWRPRDPRVTAIIAVDHDDILRGQKLERAS